MKFMKILLPLVFVLASAPSFAVDAAITKTASPGVIIVTNGGTGLAQFNILSANFPSGTLSKTKTLLGIDWQTTLYPNNPGETVQLCYYRPYSSTEVGCTTILRNSSGTVSNFNTQPFGPGAKVIIRHLANGGPQPAYPAGQDTVTFRYSY